MNHKSTGIRIENSKDVLLSNNYIQGFDIGVDILNSSDIKVVNSVMETLDFNDPNKFIKSLNSNPRIENELNQAKQGNTKSIAFLKSISEKIVVETVAISYKAWLLAHGIDI
ncbi:hypothetical protein CSV72_09870 [Sporosarcina sp. P20a]|uniref:hypothetical protein n=1 Tax=Sporosarcina sp. P20a TaxID=2048256 RepID=UPI000C16E481|nr:hypothetical protein [Sporosarcina sp. P20a]PIC86114.1 hypothetical protein CSV72_09870 [Sporosarcina sp. P20a]